VVLNTFGLGGNGTVLVFTTALAAAKLELAEQTIKYHVYEGTLEAEQPGHDLLFDEVRLDEFNQNKRGPGRPRKRKEQEHE